LPVVLYECETGSNTLREERRLTVFENRLLRRIFKTKRGEVRGKWRRLHNEELKDLYSDNQIKKNEMGVRPEGRRPLGRPRRRWEDNIEMDFQEVNWGKYWKDLAQERGRVTASCNSGKGHWGSIKCTEFLAWIRAC